MPTTTTSPTRDQCLTKAAALLDEARKATDTGTDMARAAQLEVLARTWIQLADRTNSR